MGDRLTYETIRAGRYYTDYGSSSYNDYTYRKFVGQLIWGGDGHYGYPDFPRDRDVGGDFQVRNSVVSIGSTNVGTIQGGQAYKEHHYTGDLLCNIGSYGYVDFQSPQNYMASLYSKMKPDKPNMQLANALYELREVPGMLSQRFLTGGLKDIGNYYLALKFGWEPLLRDIRSFVLTQMNGQQRLEQLLRDEGKPVMRRLTLNDDTSQNWDTLIAGTDFYPGFVGYFYGPNPWTRRKEDVFNKIWAVARFRYWLPPGPRNVDWKRSMLAKIFGLKPTPKVVWNAMPWSWLVDWFTGVGDLIDNLDTSIVDRLGADYFYTMREAGVRQTNTTSATFFQDKTLNPFTATATSFSTTSSKMRLKGDPFGWGTQMNSLSGVQLSILGALGLSRLR